MQRTLHWLYKAWNTAKGSIAYYPAVIAVLFMIASGLMLELDFSEFGKNMKASYKWLRLRDASTARSIISTIAAGMLSFTVFSFSMVMILLTQAAGQLSNRILSNLIGRRFQQVVLACYIGTILYALFLLTAIRDIDSGIYIPALSIYLLILLTIGDIFLFIAFLHFVTQSVRFETVVGNIFGDTERAIKARAATGPPLSTEGASEGRIAQVNTPVSGYFQGFDRVQLVGIAARSKLRVHFLHPVGTHLLTGMPLLQVHGAATLSADEEHEIRRTVDFFTGQSVGDFYGYGFRHLTEIALRALSPGINDPSTAVLALHAIGRLLLLRMECPPDAQSLDADGVVRVVTLEPSLDDLIEDYLWPVWDYGKDDRYVQQAMGELLLQLANNASVPDAAPVRRLLTEVQQVTGKGRAARRRD